MHGRDGCFDLMRPDGVIVHHVLVFFVHGVAERRLFPALSIKKSGTRREELLLTDNELQKLWVLRKVLNPMEDAEILELILDRMKKSKTNEAFLASMNAGTAAVN